MKIRRKKVDVKITDADGNVIFEQNGVEVPTTWSQQAISIAASKYFNGDGNDREFSVFGLVHRVADAITNCGVKDGYFDRVGGDSFQCELEKILLDQEASFNSPVWSNCGINQQQEL